MDREWALLEVLRDERACLAAVERRIKDRQLGELWVDLPDGSRSKVLEAQKISSGAVQGALQD